MSRNGVQSLRQLVTESKDIFRLKLGADPPANVKPLVIKLRDGAEPVRMSTRKYATPQLKFMRGKIRELEELGLVYKNTGAEWASPPLILPRQGPDQYRMTVDLRVPGASTQPTAWPMPNLQDECTTCMAQKYLQRWIFAKAIGRDLCTKIYKTVNRSSCQMECTHRHVYYIELGKLRSQLHGLCLTFRMSERLAWLRSICDAGLLSRLLADTSAQRFTRLSIFHHARWSEHTDKCTTWNEERYE
jgi:hypothetical protein